ncbi:hypothetical protein IFR05_011445 [Cadophora sp. M221]|nr:hypothetical protein IFR05_011445 [Cadophora sp. M221]
MVSSNYSSTRSANELPLPPIKNQHTSSSSSSSVHKAIRCGHLKSRVTVEQLRDHFLLSPGLQYVYLPLKRNDEPKNYGIVSFEDIMSAQLAQKALNGIKLCGKPLSLSLTHPMSAMDIRFSKSADPRSLSDKDIHRITSATQRSADSADMRLKSENDLPLKRQLSKRKLEERNQPRIQNLAKLLGVEDGMSGAIDFDKIVQDIDNNYRHESELSLSSRNLKF